jgi:hypothetical protein
MCRPGCLGPPRPRRAIRRVATCAPSGDEYSATRLLSGHSSGACPRNQDVRGPGPQDRAHLGGNRFGAAKHLGWSVQQHKPAVAPQIRNPGHVAAHAVGIRVVRSLVLDRELRLVERKIRFADPLAVLVGDRRIHREPRQVRMGEGHPEVALRTRPRTWIEQRQAGEGAPRSPSVAVASAHIAQTLDRQRATAQCAVAGGHEVWTPKIAGDELRPRTWCSTAR